MLIVVELFNPDWQPVPAANYTWGLAGVWFPSGPVAPVVEPPPIPPPSVLLMGGGSSGRTRPIGHYIPDEAGRVLDDEEELFLLLSAFLHTNG